MGDSDKSCRSVHPRYIVKQYPGNHQPRYAPPLRIFYTRRAFSRLTLMAQALA